jgi:hypothetical protein
MTFAALLLSGLLGIVAHWYVNFKKRRTTSTFKEYLLENGGDTIQSVSANLASVVGLYQATPTLSVMSCITAYLAGYALDNALNKDANAPTVDK